MSKVYVATKSRTRAWAEAPTGCHKVDVTSAQREDRLYRRAFSPMHVADGVYEAPDGHAYACFEHFWQSRKVYEGISRDQVVDWWRAQTKAKRRYPPGRTRRVIYATDDRWPTEKLDYIASRKRIYVIDYTEKLHSELGQTALCAARTELAHNSVVVYDYDGPKDADGTPLCAEVTRELLVEKINDPDHPFGHGYIVAAHLADISVADYAA